MADNSDGPVAAHKTFLERFWLPIILSLIGLASAILPILLKGSGDEAHRSEPRREVPPGPEKPPVEKPRPIETAEPKEPVLPRSGPVTTKLDSAQFPILSRLASAQERTELASCNPLLAELGITIAGFDSIPFDSFPESDEWVHECNLEESSFNDAAALANVINKKLLVNIAPQNDGGSRVWVWTLAGLHRGAHLDLMTRNGVATELVVISAYETGNYCLTSDDRQNACGSWGDGKPLQIFSRAGAAYFTFKLGGDSLHGTWEIKSSLLALYVEPGQQICGELKAGKELRLEPQPSRVVANACLEKSKCAGCSKLLLRD